MKIERVPQTSLNSPVSSSLWTSVMNSGTMERQPCNALNIF